MSAWEAWAYRIVVGGIGGGRREAGSAREDKEGKEGTELTDLKNGVTELTEGTEKKIGVVRSLWR